MAIKVYSPNVQKIGIKPQQGGQGIPGQIDVVVGATEAKVSAILQSMHKDDKVPYNRFICGGIEWDYVGNDNELGAFMWTCPEPVNKEKFANGVVYTKHGDTVVNGKIYKLVDSELVYINETIDEIYTDHVAMESQVSGLFKELNAYTKNAPTKEDLEPIRAALAPRVELVSVTDITATKDMAAGKTIAAAYIPSWNDPDDKHLYVLSPTTEYTGTATDFLLYGGMAYLRPQINAAGSTVKEIVNTILGISIAHRNEGKTSGYVPIGSDYTRISKGQQLMLRKFKVDLSYDKDGIESALYYIY